MYYNATIRRRKHAIQLVAGVTYFVFSMDAVISECMDDYM
jgi:hypothetical protein